MAKHEVTKFVAALPLLTFSLNDVLEILRCWGFVIKSLDNLLTDIQTKCNITLLMQHRMPLYEKRYFVVRIFDLELYFVTVVATTRLKLIGSYIF